MEAEQLLDTLVRLCQVSARDDLLYITERDKTNFPWIAEQLKSRRAELGQIARKVVQAARVCFYIQTFQLSSWRSLPAW
jgi:hypothetical protein